ncbi:MAG: YcnI family protein [Alphaproteobacteria bacterium]|nr:YcnI family protein [Alphaproteobacteria bacterium]
MRALCASFAVLAGLALPAHAHVTLETQQAVAGTYYKAVLRVGHGCEGTPMHTIRVQIPDGVVAVKPMPKPGWQLSTKTGKLAQPISDGHGGQITEGVREITWSGGKLLDEHYDEFVFRGRLPDKPNTTLYIPVVQECEKGVHRWIEIPAEGKKADDYKEPAPAVRILPKP